MSPFLSEQRREAPQNAGPSNRLPFLWFVSLGKQRNEHLYIENIKLHKRLAVTNLQKYKTDNVLENQEQIMRENISVTTSSREELVDITDKVQEAVSRSGIDNGLAVLYVQGATAAVMIQENWDESVQTDVVNLLRQLIPRGVWLHDQQDGNGDSHLKAGLVGPSESIPIIDGKLGLSRWQNIFLCEFDGPRSNRNVVCTIISAE